MIQEPSLDVAKQQPGIWAKPLQSGSGNHLGLGQGGYDDGSTLMPGMGADPSGAATVANTGPVQSGQAHELKPDRKAAPAIKDAVKFASPHTGKQEAAPPEEAIKSPTELDAQFKQGTGLDVERAKQMHMGAEEYKQQYLHEYMARLTQTDPFRKDEKGAQVSNYTNAQQNSLSAWGYETKIDPANVVDHNDTTGLFAIRYEPTAAGAKSGRAPVVAFRGTEPDNGAKDGQADMRGKYVGETEYEPGKADVAKLFGHKKGEKADVVGYSLGGALAQRSLVDNGANVRSLSTFQSPGLDVKNADKVNDQIKDNKIDVHHHFFSNDIVHRAGEKKSDGAYYKYDRKGWILGRDELDAHTSSFLIPSDGGNGSLDVHGKTKGSAYTNGDTVRENGNPVFLDDKQLKVKEDASQVKITPQDHDTIADRAFWEAQRRASGPSMANLLDLGTPTKNLFQATDNQWNPIKGPDGKVQPGPLQLAINQGQDGLQETKNGFNTLKTAKDEGSQGLRDMLHGSPLQGAMEITQGLGDGYRGVQQTRNGVNGMWDGYQNGKGTLDKFWKEEIVPRGGDFKTLANGLPTIAAHMAHDEGVQSALGPNYGPIAERLATSYDQGRLHGFGDTAAQLGHEKYIQQKLGPDGGPIVEGLAKAYDQGQPLVQQTSAGLNSAKREIGDGFQTAKSGFGETAQGTGEAGHGALDLMTMNFSKGGRELWDGAEHVVGGMGNGFNGLHNMMTGVEHGEGTLHKAWDGTQQIWNDDILSQGAHYKALASQGLQKITQPISNAYHRTEQAVSNGYHNVENKVVNGYHTAVDATKRGINTVENKISNGYHTAVDATARGINTVENKISNGYHTAVDATARGINTVENKISNGYHTAVDATARGINTVENKISNGYHTAVDATKQGIDTVETGISNGYHSTVDATKRGMHNLGTGVSNGYHALSDKVSSLFHW